MGLHAWLGSTSAPSGRCLLHVELFPGEIWCAPASVFCLLDVNVLLECVVAVLVQRICCCIMIIAACIIIINVIIINS